MSLSSLKKVTASWNLDSAGYVSSKTRFTDQSGNSRHFPVVEGTPSFTTLGSHEALSNVREPDFKAYLNNPIPIWGAFVAVFYNGTDAGNDSTSYYWSADTLDTPAGQHGTGIATDGSQVDEYDEGNASIPQRHFSIHNGSARVGMVNGARAAVNFTKDQWNVVAGGLHPEDGRAYASLNGGAWVVSDPPGNRRFEFAVEGVLGMFGQQASISAGGRAHALRRLTFIRDNLLVNQTSEFAAHVAQLKTEHGIA